MTDEMVKKRGLLRRTAGALGRGSAKAIGTTVRVTAKGTGKFAKASFKGAGKGSWIVAKGTGKKVIQMVNQRYPRLENESLTQYRIRMAKKGLRVSYDTGSIIAIAALGVDDEVADIIYGIDLTTALVQELNDSKNRNHANT